MYAKDFSLYTGRLNIILGCMGGMPGPPMGGLGPMGIPPMGGGRYIIWGGMGGMPIPGLGGIIMPGGGIPTPGTPGNFPALNAAVVASIKLWACSSIHFW